MVSVIAFIRKILHSKTWQLCKDNYHYCLDIKLTSVKEDLERLNNTISLSRHEQVCLIRIRFERSSEKYPSKRILIKHTSSWHDKRIVLWTLNRQTSKNIFIYTRDLPDLVFQLTTILYQPVFQLLFYSVPLKNQNQLQWQ